MIHLGLHFLVPAILVGLFYPKRWAFAYLVMVGTMVVDVDHLLANPVYDPGRCSIGFHPLHQPWSIIGYALLAVVPKTRLVGMGLLVHMFLDSIDCQVTGGVWIHPEFLGG